jgi:hypothetical protein
MSFTITMSTCFDTSLQDTCNSYKYKKRPKVIDLRDVPERQTVDVESSTNDNFDMDVHSKESISYKTDFDTRNSFMC